MAKAKKESVSKSPAPATNLFAKAAKAAADKPKKKGGTLIQLPKQLDTEGTAVESKGRARLTFSTNAT